jgi:hypothetical protein
MKHSDRRWLTAMTPVLERLYPEMEQAAPSAACSGFMSQPLWRGSIESGRHARRHGEWTGGALHRSPWTGEAIG